MVLLVIGDFSIFSQFTIYLPYDHIHQFLQDFVWVKLMFYPTVLVIDILNTQPVYVDFSIDELWCTTLQIAQNFCTKRNPQQKPLSIFGSSKHQSL